MRNSNYYTSGEFAKMAHISVRTVRYYDKLNILKPSYVNESGTRFYSDTDFTRLQQILLLKYLGFSLEDIRNIIVDDTDYHMLKNSLNLQLKLIQDRIEQMQLVANAIQDTTAAIESNQEIDWNQMLDLIHLTNIENSYNQQYQNANNISARIQLHKMYSVNKLGWFPWVFEQCNIKSGMNILEIGCGNGSLWIENHKNIPENVTITLNDISEGMLRDTRRALGGNDKRFTFSAFDCEHIPFEENSYDLIIANHVLFYCKDLPCVLSEIKRVLKDDGVFICSTYGRGHMKEIRELVSKFDNNIVLSGHKLYEHFGLENGKTILSPFFLDVKTQLYEDALNVDAAEPLIEYILSCHGNQNQYILDRYKDFRNFVEKKTKKGFHITKEAGIFICRL